MVTKPAQVANCTCLRGAVTRTLLRRLEDLELGLIHNNQPGSQGPLVSSLIQE